MTSQANDRRFPWLRLLRLRSPRRSARLRLTLVYGGLFLISGIVLLAATYFLFERATEYRAPDLPKVSSAASLRGLPQLAVARRQLGQVERQLAQALPRWGQAPTPVAEAEVQLKALQHQYQQTNPRLPAALTPPPLARAERQLVQAQQQLAGAVRTLELAQHQLGGTRHQLAEDQRELALAVRQMVEAGPAQAAQRTADSHELLVNSGIALAVVALLAVLAGWLVAGRILRPIRTITGAARRISSTSLHERLALDGPQDELKELGDTLDGLFARLEAAFDAQRHFVANASHELRTPLTRERALVQVALGDPSTPDVWRSTAGQLLASNREQEALIEALLTLACSEGGLDYRERTDLSEICPAVLARQGPVVGRLGLQVHTAIGSAPLDGDPRLVERLVANLVDNAIAHNVTGGCVDVRAGVERGAAVLSVTNSGPVVPTREVARLFQPFQRLERSRTLHKNGYGLGLSIVQAIATSHGAAITAVALAEGGLSVEVVFPAPTSADGAERLRARRVPAAR